jgi:hypothetical protein
MVRFYKTMYFLVTQISTSLPIQAKARLRRASAEFQIRFYFGVARYPEIPSLVTLNTTTS